MGFTGQYLFIYGSFLREAAPPGIRAVCRRLRTVATASVSGTLHDVDGYPALTMEPSDVPVHGEIVTVGSPSAWLRLDTYEGVDRAKPQRSLFRRTRTLAATETGERIECWVYVYNRDVSTARRIEHGCWRTHLFQQDTVAAVLV